MAYDRMLPAAVARVSKRTGAPVVAIGICAVMSLIMGWLYLFTSFSTLTLAMPLILTIYFSASILSGVLLPFKKGTKQMYLDSPISKYKIFGIPSISVIGVIALLYNAFLLIAYLVDPRYGVNSPLSYAFIGAIIVIALLLYFGFRGVRRQEGINTDITYKELPTD